jgi:hypothetical protein
MQREIQTAKSLARIGVVAADAASVQKVGMKAAYSKKRGAFRRTQSESPAEGRAWSAAER